MVPMPDLGVLLLILIAVAVIVSTIIWNIDRFRNDGADPLVNPSWTILIRPSRRRLPRPNIGSSDSGSIATNEGEPGEI
jgi:hypothetical protein